MRFVYISMVTNNYVPNTIPCARKDLYNHTHIKTLVLHLIPRRYWGWKGLMAFWLVVLWTAATFEIKFERPWVVVIGTFIHIHHISDTECYKNQKLMIRKLAPYARKRFEETKLYLHNLQYFDVMMTPKLFSWKTRTWLSCMFNVMAADDFEMQGAMGTGGMGLIPDT